MSTKIILTAPIVNLGAEGELVSVADGYARNFLFPRKLAMPATPGNVKRVELLRKKRDADAAAQLAEAQELIAKLAKQSFTITASAGADEKLYGSVTAADIADALKKEGLDIDRRKIALEHPIRTTGVFDVDVKLHPDVSAKVKIWVVAGEGEKPVAGAEATPIEKPKKSSKKKQ